MPTHTPRARSKRPLIDSPFALRVLATAVTLTTFTGISAFAATHVTSAAAPLQPSTSPAGAATPAPLPTTSGRRTNLGPGFTTTTTPALTRTRRS